MKTEKEVIDELSEHSTPRLSMRYTPIANRGEMFGRHAFLFLAKPDYVIVEINKGSIPDLIKDLQNAMDK